MSEKDDSKGWRGLPVTIGVLVAAVVAAVTVGGFALAARGWVEEGASKAVVYHKGADIDAAHTGLKNRYLSREEFYLTVGEMKSDIRTMKAAMQRIEKALEEDRRRSPRRRRR